MKSRTKHEGNERTFAVFGFKGAIATAVSVLLSVAASRGSQPLPGDLDVHWDEGAADCGNSPHPPLQIHAYDRQTFILRQSLCESFEGNFLYLLIGSDRALLIDTGAITDPNRMPLAHTVLTLLPEKGKGKLPLLVVHTHSHLDHRAGDPQFVGLPSVEVVGTSLEAVRSFFGFRHWPDGMGQIELGGRTVDVIPTPGHHPTHVAFYDRRTAVLFSGDFLMPGRLLIDDRAAFQASALRTVDFLKTRPLTHILGAHIELDAAGQAFAVGSHYHPNEHRLELTRQDLLALAPALRHFNGFYAHYPGFILSNPMHNLAALGAAVIAFIGLLVWSVRRWFRRRRRRAPASN